MTDPKPPDNLFHASISPNNYLAVDGAPFEEDIGTYDTYRGIEIEIMLDVLKYLSSPSKGDKELIQRLMDLVAKERKNGLDYLADARKVSLGLEDRLRLQTESTASATSFGTNHLTAVQALSEERADTYKKCIVAWKSKHSVLQISALARTN